MRRFLRGPVRVCFFIALIATLSWVLLIRFLQPLDALDHLLDDLMVVYTLEPAPQSDRIVIIALTDQTLAAMPCRSPIDRRLLSRVIDELRAKNVAAIGVDVLLDQPTNPGADGRLRESLEGAGAPVVVISADEATPLTEGQEAHLADYTQGLTTGFANLGKEGIDSVVRWHFPLNDRTDASFPAMLARAVGEPLPPAPFEIAWRGTPSDDSRPFATYPAEAIAFLPEPWLEGKIALIGAIASDIDRHRTPLTVGNGNMAGVEIQAHVLDHILADREVFRLPWPLSLGLTVLVGFGAAMLAFLTLPLILLVVAGLALVVIFWGAAIASLASLSLFLPALPMSLTALTSLGLSVAWRQREAVRERRAIMGLFARHVSSEVVDEIWRQRTAFMDGGRPRPQELTATVLFSDVEGSTTMAEDMKPQRFVVWLDRYLDAMSRVIGEHDGIVLRFVGDGILAVFGAPIARSDPAAIAADARNALRCAEAMNAELTALNAEFSKEGLPEVRIRVGIHTGLMVAGSFGSARHMEYGLVGDAVNTAARLESLARDQTVEARQFCRIITSQETLDLAGWQEFDAGHLGMVELRGKVQAIHAFSLRPRLLTAPAMA
ncbi:MAG: adenylate/guanylate cyclase domain-containing protein [Pseudomonadota bacterium]